MKQFFFFLLMAGLTTLTSCAKEGPEGPAGKDGQDGTNGTNGINGQDGNANVKSATYTIAANNWVKVNALISFVDLNVPIVTEPIASTGLVMVYRQVGDVWVAWPYTTGNERFWFWAKTGLVRIHAEDIITQTPDEFTDSVRVIAVSSSGLARNPDLDWTDYEAVKNAFDLAD
jgi:hypothetical protein